MSSREKFPYIGQCQRGLAPLAVGCVTSHVTPTVVAVGPDVPRLTSVSARYPSQSGLRAEPSTRDVVLNGSYRPVIAASWVLASTAAICVSDNGPAFTAANACSRIGAESMPVITTATFCASAYCRHSIAVAVLLCRMLRPASTFMASTPVPSASATGITCLARSEEHTSELQSLRHLVCRL